MTQTEFHLIFEQQVKRCEETLLNKAKEYTGNSPEIGRASCRERV